MKRTLALFCLLLTGVAACAQSVPQGWAPIKDKAATTRTLTGRVVNGAGSPLTNAVVYLTNTRTLTVKTYIVATDGSYRFPSLSPNVDYQVYAQVGEQKSDTKTLSSFDGRKDPVINIHLDLR
jgi:Carboxypeptidase regulatory-like domain